jgi:hypothetical protein
MKRLINILCALLLTSAMQVAIANVNAPATCNLLSNCNVFTETSTNPASGAVRSATAMFWGSGPDLYVELTNSATSDVGVPKDVVTGLFFTLMEVGSNRALITLSAGDNPLPPFKNTVQLKFTLPSALNVASVGGLTNVGFEYGAALPVTSAVGPLPLPLPGTISLILLAFAAFWWSNALRGANGKALSLPSRLAFSR